MSTTDDRETRSCVSCGLNIAGTNAAAFKCPDCGQQIYAVPSVASRATSTSVPTADSPDRNYHGKSRCQNQGHAGQPRYRPRRASGAPRECPPRGAKINGVERDEVAFGLVALYPTVIVPDGSGGTETVEESFADVEGVESVGVENVGRI